MYVGKIIIQNDDDDTVQNGNEVSKYGGMHKIIMFVFFSVISFFYFLRKSFIFYNCYFLLLLDFRQGGVGVEPKIEQNTRNNLDDGKTTSVSDRSKFNDGFGALKMIHEAWPKIGKLGRVKSPKKRYKPYEN